MEQSLREKAKKNDVSLCVISITSKASTRDLFESLEKESKRVRIGMRAFCGDILEKALIEKEKYEGPLIEPFLEGGRLITCVVSLPAKEELENWALSRKRNLASHCAFILEKWLEMRPKPAV